MPTPGRLVDFFRELGAELARAFSGFLRIAAGDSSGLLQGMGPMAIGKKLGIVSECGKCRIAGTGRAGCHVEKTPARTAL
jgi:hypothetical protein